MGDLNYRINLPPAVVLEYVQASAMSEHANFVTKSTTGDSPNDLLNPGEADGWGPTWRDARFQDLLERNFHKGDKTELDETESHAPMLNGFRRMLSKLEWSSFGPRGFSARNLFRRQEVATPRTPKALGLSFSGLGSAVEHEAKDQTMDVERGPNLDFSNLRRVDTDWEEQNNFWGWVVEHDELTQAMQNGDVLFGFVEAPITFPPTFKWKEEGSGGNFTDMDVLKGAFTNKVSK